MPISDRSKEKKVKKRYISYFGALREDKGIENLLYISNFVPENIHSAGFSTGTKKSEEYFKRVKSSGKFVIHKKNYLNLISKSKVVLFPYNDLSSTIDTPLAMLEAMERGSVVLTSNLAPLKDFLPEECLVDNWKNKKEVLDKIKYLEKNNKKLSKKMMKIVSKLETDEKSFIKNYKKLFS